MLWKYFVLALVALLPLINPVGSAFVFLGLVGEQPAAVYRDLALRIAGAVLLFLLVIEFLGSLLLRFFGISLPVIQITGGLVIASTAWRLLFEKDAANVTLGKHQEVGAHSGESHEGLDERIFYPFTFPVTAGPGSLVVVLTFSARASAAPLPEKVAIYAAIALAGVISSGLVYLSYGYAPRLIEKISPSTAHGILRVVAFLLMAIGVQLAWNGLASLSNTL